MTIFQDLVNIFFWSTGKSYKISKSNISSNSSSMLPHIYSKQIILVQSKQMFLLSCFLEQKNRGFASDLINTTIRIR